MSIIWSDKSFKNLDNEELYAILRLRSEVFVVEQNCVFLDMDGKDSHCHHLMCREEKNLLAYARIVPAEISYAEISIGRIVSSPMARGRGIGKQLLPKAIQLAYKLHGVQVIRIGAQYYLKGFYESFGFIQDSEIYLEDGIQHIEMILPIY